MQQKLMYPRKRVTLKPPRRLKAVYFPIDDEPRSRGPKRLVPQSFHFQLSSYAVVGGDPGLDQFNAEVCVVVVSLISSD